MHTQPELAPYQLPRARKTTYLRIMDMPARRLAACISCGLVLLALLVSGWWLGIIPLAIVALPLCGLPLFKGRYGIEIIDNKIRSFALLRKGGILTQKAVGHGNPLTKEGDLEHINVPIYQANGKRDTLTVIHNKTAGTHSVFLQIVDWKGVRTANETNRMSKDMALARVIDQMGVAGALDHCILLAINRSSIDTLAMHEYDQYTTGAEDDPENERLVEEYREDLAEAIAETSDITYAFGIVAPAISTAKVSKNERKGKSNNIPIVRKALDAANELAGIGMSVVLLEEDEALGLAQKIFDPADIVLQEAAALDLLVRTGKKEKSAYHEVLAPLTVQEGLNFDLKVLPKGILQCGSSYHAFVEITRFNASEINAGMGLLDDLFHIKHWCVSSIMVKTETKGAQRQIEKQHMLLSRARWQSKVDKGGTPATKQMIEAAENERMFDELDLATGGVAVFSVVFMLSDSDPDDLDEYVTQLLRVLPQTANVKLRRVTDPALIPDAFYTAVGLK